MHTRRLLGVVVVAGLVAAACSSAATPTATDQTFLIPDRDGFLQFSTRLIERRVLTRQATKGPPKKSALGSVGLAASPEVSNEILNDIQRDRGGDPCSRKRHDDRRGDRDDRTGCTHRHAAIL